MSADARPIAKSKDFCILHAEYALSIRLAPNFYAAVAQTGGMLALLALSLLRSKNEQCRPMERTEIKDAEAESANAGNLAQFSVARPDRVADQVYRHLRQAILSEQIAAGTRLRETEVAAALKVSRTPVREAISRLIGDWLVRELNTGGVEVIDTMSEMEDIYHIREALELCAARLAAKRITPKQLAKLDKLVKEARTASFKERVRINQQFHVTIAEASGSPRLLDMISGFREYFLNRLWISRQNTTMAKRAQDDHKKIVAALRSGSADKVERILRSHLKLGWEELIAHAKSSG